MTTQPSRVHAFDPRYPGKGWAACGILRARRITSVHAEVDCGNCLNSIGAKPHPNARKRKPCTPERPCREFTPAHIERWGNCFYVVAAVISETTRGDA